MSAPDEKKVYPILTELENGDRKQENEDGTTIVTKPDGTVIDDTGGFEISRDPAGNETFELKSKRQCVVRAGKGVDAEKAQRQIIGDKGAIDDAAYMRALMCELVLIDGKRIVPEDMMQMPLGDYMRIRGRFMIINF